MIRAFIFDLDGTLLDSMDEWDTIGYEYLRGKGVQHIPDTLRETIKPLSMAQTAQLFIDEYGICLPPQEICDEINMLVENMYRHEVQLKAGVKEFLRAHRHIPMAVATATDRHLVEAALQRLGIDGCFRFILTSTEVGNSKQSPDIFLQAAQRLGVDIGEALVFEDALHAIRTAKLAGFPTVGIYEPCFEQEAEEIKRYADQYVRNLNEVIL